MQRSVTCKSAFAQPQQGPERINTPQPESASAPRDLHVPMRPCRARSTRIQLTSSIASRLLMCISLLVIRSRALSVRLTYRLPASLVRAMLSVPPAWLQSLSHQHHAASAGARGTPNLVRSCLTCARVSSLLQVRPIEEQRQASAAQQAGRQERRHRLRSGHIAAAWISSVHCFGVDCGASLSGC